MMLVARASKRVCVCVCVYVLTCHGEGLPSDFTTASCRVVFFILCFPPSSASEVCKCSWPVVVSAPYPLSTHTNIFIVSWLVAWWWWSRRLRQRCLWLDWLCRPVVDYAIPFRRHSNTKALLLLGCLFDYWNGSHTMFGRVQIWYLVGGVDGWLEFANRMERMNRATDPTKRSLRKGWTWAYINKYIYT